MPKRNVDLSAPFQTLPNACRLTGLSTSFLRQGCRDGRVPHIKAGSTFLVNVPLLLQRLNEESEAGKA